MPSPRSRFESACRVGAFALIGWLVGTTVIRPNGRRLERASEAQLPTRLVAWTRAAPTVALHGNFAATPEPWAADWLGALARSGHPVTWSGAPPAVAMSAESSPEPGGGTRIDIGAPDGSHVALRDDASTIDSVVVAKLGASVTVPIVVGRVVGATGGERFSAMPPDSAPARAIVVIGQAGWEGKFVVAALEARGWPVIARFAVAPNVEVDQGLPGATGAPAALTLDTSRVGAVVALDTTVARYRDAIIRFVRAGGGLVLAGPSSLSASVADLAPGALGARTRPAVQATDAITLGSTGFYLIGALKQDGVVLERRPAGIAVAARRVGAGRVMQLGYDDSWRWRMAGATGSEAAHRDWWSRVVSAVTYLPGAPVTNVAAARVPSDESAPLARLVDRLGPARAAPPVDGPRAPLDRRIFLALIMILLLAEWGSRRLRGLR